MITKRNLKSMKILLLSYSKSYKILKKSFNKKMNAMKS